MRLSEEGELNQIFNFLHRLGATANYTGFFYTAYGTLLCMKEPCRLTLVTKWLYPDVARYYDTNWKAVERSIRTIISYLWNNHAEMLNILAGYPMKTKPSPAEFLSILVVSLSEQLIA